MILRLTRVTDNCYESITEAEKAFYNHYDLSQIIMYSTSPMEYVKDLVNFWILQDTETKLYYIQEKPFNNHTPEGYKKNQNYIEIYLKRSNEKLKKRDPKKIVCND